MFSDIDIARTADVRADPPLTVCSNGWSCLNPVIRYETGCTIIFPSGRQPQAPLSIFRGVLMAFFGSTLLSTVIAKNGVNISSQVMLPK